MPDAPSPDAPSPDEDGLPQLPVAGLGRRLLALTIDWVASLLLVRLLFSQFAYGSTESAGATMAVFAAEVIVLTWLIGCSFGQRLVGIRVVRLDGARLDLWRSVVRTLLICLVIPAVVFDSSGRGLHDRAVGSVAIRVLPGYVR